MMREEITYSVLINDFANLLNTNNISIDQIKHLCLTLKKRINEIKSGNFPNQFTKFLDAYANCLETISTSNTYTNKELLEKSNQLVSIFNDTLQNLKQARESQNDMQKDNYLAYIEIHTNNVNILANEIAIYNENKLNSSINGNEKIIAKISDDYQYALNLQRMLNSEIAEEIRNRELKDKELAEKYHQDYLNEVEQINQDEMYAKDLEQGD